MGCKLKPAVVPVGAKEIQAPMPKGGPWILISSRPSDFQAPASGLPRSGGHHGHLEGSRLSSILCLFVALEFWGIWGWFCHLPLLRRKVKGKIPVTLGIPGFVS